MKKFFSKFFKVAFHSALVVVCIALLLSYLAPVIPPSSSMLIAFCGLAYPVSLSMFLILGALYIFASRKRKVKLLLLLVLLLGISEHSHFFGSNLSSPDAKGSTKLAMSYNVRLFDLYRWSEEDHYHDSIVDFLAQKQPAILGIQEFFHADLPHVEDTRYTLTNSLSAKDFHEKFSPIMNGEQFFGVVTFAEDKILNRGHVDFGKSQNNFCIYTDVLHQGQPLRVYHAHLASIRFEPEDYSTIEKRITFNGVKNIAKRLHTAFIKREVQVEKVRAALEDCPHPFILLGDFNDPPTSYTYGTLSEGLNDAFLECSWGVGSTYRGKFPSFRIDYIFGSPEVKFSSFEVHSVPYSDHFPISAEFELASP